ncbi:MAG: hypothetical protein O9353_00510 [Bacteroidia bacterium]|nr:hypothetical protein [Bacteroidia bacterium]
MRIILISIILLTLIACRDTSSQDNQVSPKKHNSLQDKTPDTSSLRTALKQRLVLIKEFNDTISPDIDSNYYHLILYSTFHEGTAVKFIKKGGAHFMSVKTLRPDSSLKLEVYYTKISKNEWDKLETMIDNFDFWTEEQFTYNEVLDGYTFYLEGNRSSDNGKLHRLVGRGSPRYDKIGALCNYILDYQESLVFQYRQINR